MLSWLSGHRPRRVATATLVGVGALWAVIRFVGLETAPRGFWMDEAWDAVHAMCLSETGRDADKRSWPLFSEALAGGTLPITWTAPMVAWTRLFGTSIRSFRTPSVLWILLTCAGLFGIARALVCLAPPAGDGSRRAIRSSPFPWLVLLAALVSPWSFQFSRIAWEGPIAPAFLVLALLAMVRLRLTGRWRWALACGLFGGLSMISYPPLRVAVPFVLTLTGLLLLASAPRGRSRKTLWNKVLVAGGALALTFAPVVVLMARGQGTERMMSVTIFAPRWLDKHRGGLGRVPFFLNSMADNLWLQLRPSYLFFVGDPNARHSAHIVGQLSPLDIFALAICLGTVAWLARMAGRQMTQDTAPPWPRLGCYEQMLVIVALYCVLAGLFAALPAALTWDGVPHALRSIGDWPFVVLFTGASLALAWPRLTWLPAAAAAVAIVYTAAFLPLYFKIYQQASVHVFHRDITEALDAARAEIPPRPPLATLRPFAKRYDDYVMRYFLMHDARLSCRESLEIFREMEKSTRDPRSSSHEPPEAGSFPPQRHAAANQDRVGTVQKKSTIRGPRDCWRRSLAPEIAEERDDPFDTRSNVAQASVNHGHPWPPWGTALYSPDVSRSSLGGRLARQAP